MDFTGATVASSGAAWPSADFESAETGAIVVTGAVSLALLVSAITVGIAIAMIRPPKIRGKRSRCSSLDMKISVIQKDRRRNECHHENVIPTIG